MAQNQLKDASVSLARHLPYERLARQHKGSSGGAGKAAPAPHGVWSLLVQSGAKDSFSSLVAWYCKVEDAPTPFAPPFTPAPRGGGANAKSTKAKTGGKELLGDSRRGSVRAWLGGHLIVQVHAVGRRCMGSFRLAQPQRDMRRLHGFLHHRHQVLAEPCQVHFLVQGGDEI
jgi:hypothetical protein